jgi:hypothetical protein
VKFKLLKALVWIVRNAPAIIEVVKQARKRHPETHAEALK